MLILLFGYKSLLFIFLPQYTSLRFTLCVLSLSHTVQASSGTTSIHYQSPFPLNAIKIRIILMPNDVFTRDCDIYCECAHGCDISVCAAGNKRIGLESARHETDRPVTDPGWSCEISANYDRRSISNPKSYSSSSSSPLLSLVTSTSEISHQPVHTYIHI